MKKFSLVLLAFVAAFAASCNSQNSTSASRPNAQGNGTASGSKDRIETRIGPLEFTHGFANGYPTDATIEKLYDERDFQRACQAYIWSLPAVSFAAWQRGITKEIGAKNGQIVAILSLEARRGILTANATTPYYLAFVDLSSGPFVFEMPPRGVQGGISDAWQNNIPDSEAPARYLVLGPGQKVPENVTGYAVRHSPTFNIFFGIRLTDADPEKAKDALAHLRVYAFAQRDNPPKSYKKECQEKNLPSARCRPIFFLGIPPNCLNVHARSESGLPQAKDFASSPCVKRRTNGSPLWFHFAVVTAPVVFLKHNKPDDCPLEEWQCMVLSETLGL